jgi:hypothetical protein
MSTTALIFLAAVIGVIVGSVGHAYLAKQATASKSELAKWAGQLRAAAVLDAQFMKAKLTALAVEIEHKL